MSARGQKSSGRSHREKIVSISPFESRLSGGLETINSPIPSVGGVPITRRYGSLWIR